MRKTKIVCTIGPASESPEMIEKLCLAGMNVARLNFSHGSHEEHKRRIDTIREVSNRLRREGKNFICGRFTEDLKAALNSTGIPVGSLQVSNNNNGIPTQDPIHIYIEYPSLFPEDTYIAPRIILEITGRANKMALDERAVNALVYDYLPKDFVVDKPVLVTTTQPRRTFIEKV